MMAIDYLSHNGFIMYIHCIYIHQWGTITALAACHLSQPSLRPPGGSAEGWIGRLWLKVQRNADEKPVGMALLVSVFSSLLDVSAVT